LVREDVAEIAAAPLHLAGRGDLEALRGRAVRLDLRHDVPCLFGDEHHRHVAALEARLLVDDRHVGDLLGDPVEHRLPELRMRDRAAAEEDGDLHPVALGEEAADVADLEVDVVDARLRPDLHFLQDHRGRLLPRLLRLLLLRVAILPVVHDPADGRIRSRRDLDQVELLLLRQAERVLRRHDAELGAVVRDDSDLPGADLPVDADLVLDLRYKAPPGMRAASTVCATNVSSGSAACAAPAVRGATVPAAASRSPTTTTTGTFSTSASRTL